MEADELCLEEGELSSDSAENYTPLERPVNYASMQPHARFPTTGTQDSDSDEEEPQSSDSDSDYNSSKPNTAKSKKPRIKLKPQVQQRPPNKRKQNDIWSTRAQEDVLSESLNSSCDVTFKDRSRDVESYDYTLGRRMYERATNKRSFNERSDGNLRLVGKGDDGETNKGSARVIPDLGVDKNGQSEDVARDIANKLCEEKDELILKVVNTMGVEKTIAIFQETQRIEQDGGMLIMNQSRRRTPGGVFLFLVRHDDDLTSKQRSAIFGDDRQKTKKLVRDKQKAKYKKMKDDIAKTTNNDKLLPDLLTRAELLQHTHNRSERKQAIDHDVINPPPTPETDGHVSGDGAEMDEQNGERKIETYDDDFLDLGGSYDMDLL